MKRRVRLTESDLHAIINESVKRCLNELDWKTYANAAKKRREQVGHGKDFDNEKFDKYFDLTKMANKRFDDDFVGKWKYDTFGDKLRGKKSPKFSSYLDIGSKNMPYGSIRGWNKGGDEIFSTEKGIYHKGRGDGVTPRQFFRDKEVADAYEKANDEAWDFNNGKYEYRKGEGWVKNESRIIGESREFDPKFNAAMKKLFRLMDDWGEMGDDICESIVNWFGELTDNYDDVYYVYSESGMFHILYALMNYDFFWVTDSGKIDIKNANAPEVARTVAPFVTPEMCMKAKEALS